ncbi:MAG TPA: signal peptidase II [bacterium]|nr:signal peptidase II [bacterium]
MKKINKIFKHKNIVVILLITMFFVLDRYLKFLAINFKEDFFIIKNVLKFTFFPNEFISFSIPFSGVVLNIVLIILLILVIIFLIWSLRKKRINDFLASLAVFFGATSNFIDRIFFSYAIDYLDLKFFPVFNLADILIVGGCFYLIYLNFKATKR